MDFEDRIYGATTIIECFFQDVRSQGTGFFFNEVEKDSEKNIDGQSYKKLLGTWLITNRHVALPIINNQEIVPNTLVFNLRRVINGETEWVPVTLRKEELLSRMKIHLDSNVDVVAIKIDDILIQAMRQMQGIMNFTTITSDNLPDSSRLKVEASDDIIVAGYPRNFYDEKNKFPIIKSGIIATKWMAYFNNNPVFLIDCKLFPGSSGSVVLSKPCNIALIDGNLMSAPNKQFILLGIFSGEPVRQEQPIYLEDITITRNQSFNVGTVWYSWLIMDIICNGIHKEEKLK